MISQCAGKVFEKHIILDVGALTGPEWSFSQPVLQAPNHQGVGLPRRNR